MKSWISSYHCIVLEVYQDSKVSDTPLQKINSVYE